MCVVLGIEGNSMLLRGGGEGSEGIAKVAVRAVVTHC